MLLVPLPQPREDQVDEGGIRFLDERELIRGAHRSFLDAFEDPQGSTLFLLERHAVV